MVKYRKLIAALVGVVAIILGPDILGLVDNTAVVTESVLAILTVFGVYQLKNEG